MEKKLKIIAELIAPCGMNCGVCIAYLRKRNKCPGCRISDINKPITRKRCKIKNCKYIKKGKRMFCFECYYFPCKYLKHLDKRYKTKYDMSMVENLLNIKDLGINKLIKNENKRWICSKCGNIVCVHKKSCVYCGNKIS
jgi:hypothetical protein